MNRVLCVVIIALLVACGALSLGLNHYRDNAITYKAQRDKNVRELKLANAAITDMQMRQPPPDWQTPLNGIISPSERD